MIKTDLHLEIKENHIWNILQFYDQGSGWTKMISDYWPTYPITWNHEKAKHERESKNT